MAEELLRLSQHLRLTVIDVDPTMVAAAAKRLGRFGDRATVEVGDAIALPYPDASFDTVVSWLMLHHTLDWEAACGRPDASCDRVVDSSATTSLTPPRHGSCTDWIDRHTGCSRGALSAPR